MIFSDTSARRTGGRGRPWGIASATPFSGLAPLGLRHPAVTGWENRISTLSLAFLKVYQSDAEHVSAGALPCLLRALKQESLFPALLWASPGLWMGVSPHEWSYS